MIPDFRTYIGESVWSDMHRRSNGSQERKEDSLDNMTLQGFYDYWHKRYNVIGKTGRAWKDMECMNHPIKKEHVFSTPIEYTHCDGFAYTYCIEMSYDYRVEEIKELRITYYDSFILDYPDFRGVFGPEYDVNENGIILIVNGKYKFHHYIDIIDKCVSMVKKPYVEIVMNESVWSDMHRRSNGSQVRKEDMNDKEFHKYLKEHYKVLDKMAFSEIGLSEYGIISVPILYDRDYERVLHNKAAIRLISSWNNCLINYISVDGSIRKTEIYEKFKDTFDLDDTVFVNGIVITPKGGGKLTPKFFLEVVDFFVDNANKNEKLLDRI